MNNTIKNYMAAVKLSILMILFTAFMLNAQDVRKDKGTFVEPKKGYYEEVIMKDAKDLEADKKPAKKSFRLDFEGMDVPKSVDEFTSAWYNDPVSQGNTGTCWCFSTTSFLESEVYRQHEKKVKLSEMYTVYWEYVEKAKRYIKERGDSEFGEGSEANAVTRLWKDYGAMPLDAYVCMLPGQNFHNHAKMYNEMNSYLTSIKERNAWNEAEAVATIKDIMKHYIGEPPATFTYEGTTYTPKEFLENYLRINPDDYVDVLSYMQQPYWEKVEYEVSDNWWHSDVYYNVPLDDFMSSLKSAVKNGYTMAIGGDVSEAGYDSWAKAAVVPTFDIPSEYIDESARQFRFSNKTTTDDHGIHLVGYKENDGKFWFLIKDSGSGSRNVGEQGFYFYHEDYVKLKIMDFMVHKDAVKDLLPKFAEK